MKDLKPDPELVAAAKVATAEETPFWEQVREADALIQEKKVDVEPRRIRDY